MISVFCDARLRLYKYSQLLAQKKQKNSITSFRFGLMRKRKYCFVCWEVTFLSAPQRLIDGGGGGGGGGGDAGSIS